MGRDTEAAECADKAGKGNHLRLAVASSKADKHSLQRQLPAALEFVSSHLAQQHRVLLHCDTGVVNTRPRFLTVLQHDHVLVQCLLDKDFYHCCWCRLQQ